MGRKPKIVRLADGMLEMRCVIPGPIWLVACELGTAMGIKVDPGDLGLRLILDQVSSLFELGDASFTGNASIQRALDRVMGANFGVLDRTGPIDLNRLHRGTLKSGFVGVYAGGNGFRAIATTPSGAKVIGVFRLAEQAAHQRWKFYKDNNLPYGEIEIEMARWRKQHMADNMSDQALIRAIIKHSREVGTYDQIFGPGTGTMIPDGFDDLAEAITEFDAMNERTPEALEALKARARKPAPPRLLSSSKPRLAAVPASEVGDQQDAAEQASDPE